MVTSWRPIADTTLSGSLGTSLSSTLTRLGSGKGMDGSNIRRFLVRMSSGVSWGSIGPSWTSLHFSENYELPLSSDDNPPKCVGKTSTRNVLSQWRHVTRFVQLPKVVVPYVRKALAGIELLCEANGSSWVGLENEWGWGCSGLTLSSVAP